MVINPIAVLRLQVNIACFVETFHGPLNSNDKSTFSEKREKEYYREITPFFVIGLGLKRAAVLMILVK